MPKKSLLLALGLSLALVLSVPGAAAQGEVRIVENRYTARFAERMTFSLVAEADQVIEGVTLFYRRQGERITNRVVPQFTPGHRVEVTHERILERGEVPPGTAMEFYWRLKLADGTEVDTDTIAFVYEDDRFAWQALQAGNIAVYYYGSAKEAALAGELLDIGQATLARLQDEMGVTSEAPARVYVYRTVEDMAATLSPRSEGYDDRVVTLGVVVSDDTLLLLGSHPDVRQTLAHELSHIVVGLATKNPYAPLPRWLDEGLAMYAEGELRPENARALRDAVRRDALISVRSLSGYTGDPTQIALYYGEVYSLVDFLLQTYGREKMAELLQVFEEGAHQEDALQQVYGLTLEELDARWRESLGLTPRPTPAPMATAAPRAETRPAQQPCLSFGVVGVLGLAGVLASQRAGRR
jgi:hypothetical protein